MRLILFLFSVIFCDFTINASTSLRERSEDLRLEEILQKTPMTPDALMSHLGGVDVFLTDEEKKITQRLEGLKGELFLGEFEKVWAILNTLEQTLIKIIGLDFLQNFRQKPLNFQKAAFKKLYPDCDDRTASFFIAYAAILLENDEELQESGLKFIRTVPFPHKPTIFETDEVARGWHMDTLLAIALDVRGRYETVEGYDIANDPIDLRRVQIYFSGRELFASALEMQDFFREKLFDIFDVLQQTHENIIATDEGHPLMTSLSDAWEFLKERREFLKKISAFLWKAELAPLQILKGPKKEDFVPYLKKWNDQQDGDHLRLRLYQVSHRCHLCFLLTLYAQGWAVDDLSDALKWPEILLKKAVGLPLERKRSKLFLQNLLKTYQEELSPKSTGLFEFYDLKAMKVLDPQIFSLRYQKIKMFFERKLTFLRGEKCQKYSQELEERIKSLDPKERKEWEVFLQHYEGKGNLFSEGAFALEKAQSIAPTAETIGQIKHAFEKAYADPLIQIFRDLRGSPDEKSEEGALLQKAGGLTNEALGIFNLLADGHIYLLNEDQEDSELAQLLGTTIALYNEARHLVFKIAAMMDLKRESEDS